MRDVIVIQEVSQYIGFISVCVFRYMFHYRVHGYLFFAQEEEKKEKKSQSTVYAL